jgi:glycosyltransferase involved in cell wall biosynthesis
LKTESEIEMNVSSLDPGNGGIRKTKILYLSLNPDLNGPLPKIDPLMISVLNNLGCQITKATWGRHSESENAFQKLFGRIGDVVKAFVTLARSPYDILYVATTLDEKALYRDVPLLLAVHWFPVKKILIEHGSKTTPLSLPGNIMYKFMTRLVVRLTDAILLLSTEEIKTWTNFEPRGHYFRVDNPFLQASTRKTGSFTNTSKETDSRPTLLFAGRLIQPKGIFDLLDAMPLILKQIDCRLLIAGDGEEKEEIKRCITKANLQERVSLLGYVDSERLAEIYRTTSVFILPTYCGEGFPTVISEAMSFGLPIVTTAIRGTADHLQNEVNTLFILPRDPESIASAVIRLLKDPKLCEEMGRANLAKVQEFAPENVVPKYFEIFSEMLKTARANTQN